MADKNLPADSVDFSHIALSVVVPFYFNQEKSASLTDQLGLYSEYSPELLDRIQFVFVDDGSPVSVEIPAELDLNILMLKISEDRVWNQGGSRNLGVVYARSDKLALTDVDHVFSERSFLEMIRRKTPGRTMYKFKRLDWEGSIIKPHPNSFFMSRARYLRHYGVDEEFCGHYGFEDSMFWRWQRYHGTRIKYLNKKKFHITLRQVDRDQSYHNLERDLEYNRNVAERKKQQMKTYGPNAGHSRLFLNFEWKIIMDRRRSCQTYIRPENKTWAVTWSWRWLVGQR